jgi:tetratricopeptide (TPR) repeat protein
VLEGSVQRVGDRIRINAQLIDGSSGNQLWAERYDGQLDDVFKVQDEITENIAGALEPQMVVAENIRVRQIPEQNLGAWELTIRAIALCREFTNKGSLGALALLDRALEIDRSYARAWSQKAWISCWRIHQGWDDAESALDRAVKAAEKAVYHDPDEPWGHIAWLFIATIKRDGDLLVSAARRAIEVNPNFAMAYSWLGAAYALTGQGEKSFEFIEKARRLSPRDMFREEFDVHTSFAYFQIGDYQKAIEFATKASIPRPDHVYPLLVRATSHAHLGMLENARNDVAKVEQLVPGYSIKVARDSCVFVNNTDIDRFIDGLRKAGLVG